MRKVITTIIILITTALSAKTRVNIKATCTSVVDGDTIYAVTNQGTRFKVRLLGIDAPESSRHRFGYIEKYGKTAKRFVKRLLLGNTVKLVTYITKTGRLYKGRYGRLLAFVFIKNVDLAKLMLLKGYAKVYRKSKSPRHKALLRYERVARERKRGIWSD